MGLKERSSFVFSLFCLCSVVVMAHHRKLILALTLLHAGNRIVAHTIYRILCSTCSDLKMFGPDITIESSLELNLIFTMALHHPSFTFEEKVKLGDIYLCMQSRLPGLRPTSDSVSPIPTSTPSLQPQSSPQISQNDLSTMAPIAAAVAVAAATTVPIAIVGSRLAKMIGQRFVVIEIVPSQTDLPTWILSPPS